MRKNNGEANAQDETDAKVTLHKDGAYIYRKVTEEEFAEIAAILARAWATQEGQLDDSLVRED